MLTPFDIAGTERVVTSGNGSLDAAGTLAGNGCVSYVWLKH